MLPSINKSFASPHLPNDIRFMKQLYRMLVKIDPTITTRELGDLVRRVRDKTFIFQQQEYEDPKINGQDLTVSVLCRHCDDKQSKLCKAIQQIDEEENPWG